jgi:hypothetical protein
MSALRVLRALLLPGANLHLTLGLRFGRAGTFAVSPRSLLSIFAAAPDDRVHQRRLAGFDLLDGAA